MTSEYQKAHSRGIGSGEIASVVGLNTFESRLHVWRSKVEGDSDEKQSWHIDRGNFLEAGLLEWMNKRTGVNFSKVNAPIVHPKFPLCIATPDGICDLDGDVVTAELKAPGPNGGFDWGQDGSGADGVPARVLAQKTWQMAAAGASHGFAGALIGGFLRVYRVDYNPDFFAALADRASEFWGYVERKEEPPADGSKACGDYITEHYAHAISREVIEPPHQIEDLIWQELWPRYCARKAANELYDETMHRIQQMMGDVGGYAGKFGKLYWRNNKPSKKINWQNVAVHLSQQLKQTEADWKACLEEHTETKPGARPFRLYPSKDLKGEG